jgi:hypothetical protein
MPQNTCVFCQSQANAPEHILRNAYINHFFPHEDALHGGYSLEIGGRPELRRDGSIWKLNNFPRIMLPCCEECNGTLNTRFEQPAEEVVRQLFSNDPAELDLYEMKLAGLWLLKTCLLLVHPEARQTARHKISLPRWNLTTIPGDMYSWMVNGQPPPVGLSVWISKVHVRKPMILRVDK